MTNLAAEIYKTAYLTGEFKLRSGQISNEYFDKYRFEGRPDLLREIAKGLAPLVPKDTEVLAGLEMGGIPVATALAIETGLPICFVRKAAKEYGTMKLAEGADINGRRVCVVEDVITTGGQVIESSNELRHRGAHVTNVLCVIDREQGGREKLLERELHLRSLFNMTELKSAAKR